MIENLLSCDEAPAVGSVHRPRSDASFPSTKRGQPRSGERETNLMQPSDKKSLSKLSWFGVAIAKRLAGQKHSVVLDPGGSESRNKDVYREVVKNEWITFTDAYMQAWESSEQPLMPVVLTFEDEGSKTRYTGACARHWAVADREAHEKLGSIKAGASGPTHSKHLLRLFEPSRARI